VLDPSRAEQRRTEITHPAPERTGAPCVTARLPSHSRRWTTAAATLLQPEQGAEQQPAVEGELAEQQRRERHLRTKREHVRVTGGGGGRPAVQSARLLRGREVRLVGASFSPGGAAEGRGALLCQRHDAKDQYEVKRREYAAAARRT
jgi:hypothetical protein